MLWRLILTTVWVYYSLNLLQSRNLNVFVHMLWRGMISLSVYSYGLACTGTTQPNVPVWLMSIASWPVSKTGSYHAFLCISHDQNWSHKFVTCLIDSLLIDQPALIAFQLLLTAPFQSIYHDAAKDRNKLQNCTTSSSLYLIFWPGTPKLNHLM